VLECGHVRQDALDPAGFRVRTGVPSEECSNPSGRRLEGFRNAETGVFGGSSEVVAAVGEVFVHLILFRREAFGRYSPFVDNRTGRSESNDVTEDPTAILQLLLPTTMVYQRHRFWDWNESGKTRGP
jgi:hypothetical protein